MVGVVNFERDNGEIGPLSVSDELMHNPEALYIVPAVAIMVTTAALSVLARLPASPRALPSSQQRWQPWHSVLLEELLAVVSHLRLCRYDAIILVGLCLAILVYSTGNLSSKPLTSDGQQNLQLGIRLAEEGHFKYSHNDIGYHEREPFVPFLLAAIEITRQALGQDPVTLDCLRPAQTAAVLECLPTVTPYKVLNVLFLLLAAVGAFFIVLWLTEIKWLAYATLILTTQHARLLRSADHFLTEVPAAALMVATAALSLLALTRRHPAYGVSLGLALAALVLTKVIFAYLWIVVAITLLVSDLLNRKLDRSSVALVGFFLVAYFTPIGVWMARNYVMSGDFSLVTGQRAAAVWSIRASYNEMRDDEFAAGFLYYPPITNRYLASLGIPRESYERFSTTDEAGFRQVGFRNLHSRGKVLRDEKNMGSVPPGKTFGQWLAVTLASEAQERMLADPWQHLKVSLLLAWRGVNRCCGAGLGYNWAFNAPRLAESWGFADWPRWGGLSHSAAFSLAHLAGFLALIAAPLCFWLTHSQFNVILITLPALYSHGMYAVSSHFIPRYAEPEIPLQIVAAALIISLTLASTRRRLVGSLAERPVAKS